MVTEVYRMEQAFQYTKEATWGMRTIGMSMVLVSQGASFSFSFNTDAELLLNSEMETELYRVEQALYKIERRPHGMIRIGISLVVISQGVHVYSTKFFK